MNILYGLIMTAGWDTTDQPDNIPPREPSKRELSSEEKAPSIMRRPKLPSIDPGELASSKSRAIANVHFPQAVNNLSQPASPQNVIFDNPDEQS